MGAPSPLLRPKTALTLGFLTTQIGEGTGRMLWSGLNEQCQANGINLVCFVGSELENPGGFLRQANAAFDLVDRQHLDGLILWTSSMATYVGPDSLQRYCERFRPLPLVGIGLPLTGIPTVMLDSYQGMRDVLVHLVQEHGRRRIAFLRGPERHREAHLRYQAYLQVVKEYGLENSPDLVSPPHNWAQAWGINAARLIMEERRQKVDAFACVNDGLAVGAMEYLIKHGIDVPREISITGFDNAVEGRVATPPLTTVPIRMRERGRQAVRMLLAQIRGETVPDLLMLPTHVLLRQSCGCPDPQVVEAGRPESTRIRLSPAEELLSTQQRLALHRADILLEMDQTQDLEDAVPGWSGELLDSFCENLGQETADSFITMLQRLMRQSLAMNGDLLSWQKVISVLRSRVTPILRSEPVKTDRADRFLHQARVLIGEVALRAQGHLDWKSSRQLNELHRIRQRVSGVQELQELVDILAAELPQIEIRRCGMALYEDPQEPLKGAHFALVFDENQRYDEQEGQWVRPAWRINPFSIFQATPHTMMVYPLYYREEQLGFIFLDALTFQGAIHQVLCEQISSALKSVMLVQQNLNLVHQALEAQRVAEEANLLKSRFLSMVSHELLTPMVLLVGLSEMMLREGIGDRPALPEAYRQDLTRIHAGAQQLGSLVRDVLDLTRSQLGQLKLSRKTMDLAQMLQPVALVGEQMARSKGLTWRFDVPEHLPHVIGDAARLQQVTMNLVNNAVKFTTHGEVALVVTLTDDQVTVTIHDTGLGVPSAEQQAIFDEFRQSERTVARGYGGLGIGLAICRQLIEMHDGKIGVRSGGEENSGSDFYFTLPVFANAPVELSEPPSQVVLVLTDFVRQAEQLHEYLLQQGFLVNVLGVDETDNWLQGVLSAPPGAVVLDLPVAERGWELLELLKRNPATRDTPIIFYSLFQDQQRLQQPAQGAVMALDYLSKPMAPAALGQALQRYGLRPGAGAGQAGAGIPTVLVADDDPGILDLHARLVGEHIPGCRVLRAANGRTALNLMRETIPALVLLDLMMPELDGAGVLKAMQEDERLREVPVIILTAQRLSQEEMSRFNHGVSAVLSKGVFTTEETLAHIDQALARSKRLGSDNQRLVRRVMAFIHEHYPEPLDREQLAGCAGVSERHLNRCFLQETGLAPIAYLNRFRIQQACELLQDRNRSITDVMGCVGFSESSYFTRVFRREVGVSPSEYQRGKRDGSSPN